MSEQTSYLQIILAFAFVVALILLLSFIMKRLRNSVWADKITGARRLKVVEQLALDSRRKLVLIRCDNEESLLVIGGQNDVVVQTQIIKPITGESNEC